MLTLKILQDHLFHALGGNPASQLTLSQIVNDAGNYMCGMHQWRFLERAPLSFSLVGGRDFVELPSDFGSMLRVVGSNTYFEPSTPEMLGTLDGASTITVSGLAYSYVITGGLAESSGREEFRFRMRLSPTPGSDALNVGKIHYRGGWVDLVSEGDVPMIPRYMEMLLVNMVREFGLGYEQNELAGRMQGMGGSDVYHVARKADGMVQSEVGPSWGGQGHPMPRLPIYGNQTASLG